MANMIKELTKNQIRKTGMFRALELENKNLKNQLNNLKSENKNLKHENKNLKSENKNLKNVKRDFGNLINNLRVENKVIKEIFERNIKTLSDYSKLTIIIPYRKTNDLEREENVDITLRYLSKIGVPNLIISEHSDESSKEFLMGEYAHLFKSFKVLHIDANGDLFNKSNAINKGVSEAETPYIAYSDMDCITKKKNVDMALTLLEKGFDVVHPFDRMVKDITNKNKFKREYDFETVNSPEQDRLWADGGIVFWNRNSFISVGMKNEYFNGWGGEDNEIIVRANLCQLKEYRINDTLYHLYHYRPQKRTQNNVDQLERIMEIKSKEDCINEVNSWPWVIEAKKIIKKGV